MRRSRPAAAGPAAALLLLLTNPAAIPADTPDGAPPSPASSAAPSLAAATLPAGGRHATILTVPDFGRYAVTVASDQGAGLQLVDRMAGPGPVAGEAGQADGRLDLFLDRGEYKVIVHGHEDAAGEARLAAHGFTELHAAAAPMLVDLKLVAAQLGDLEQVSYWIRVDAPRRVILEAAGRHLRDLRLWQDGAWLVDARPEVSTVEPAVGRPLTLCRLTARLPAGLYRLTAYGGLSQPWAEDSGERPLYLRSGIPASPEAGRRRRQVSPFGFDRFLVPGTANLFRIELPEPRPAQLRVGWYDPENPFRDAGQSRRVQKESLPPVAELRPGQNHDQLHLVTVTAPAGQPYTLQHFFASDSYRLRREGEHWISTVHTGHPADSVDATALLVQMSGSAAYRRPLAAQTVELGRERGWARRCNLLSSLTVHLRVADAGRYEILSRGVEARFRIEPFLIKPPPNYAPPPFRGGGSEWDLDAGYYVLTVEPRERGILDLVVRPHGWLDVVLEAVGLEDETAAEAVRASVRMPRVSLDPRTTYNLYLNRQPEVTAGVVLRPLPLDLTAALPLTQRPGETVKVPFSAAEPGELTARAEDGSLLEMSLDGGAWERRPRVVPGAHRVEVRHGGEATVVYSLALIPEHLLDDAPLPPLPAAALAQLPDFPLLTDREPRFLDLARDASETFVVHAAAPALYRLESTGVLDTAGNLRTRVVTSLARRAGDGVGRNFLIQQYLREGDYQVTVATRGRSAGHLGLRLERTAVVDGGSLSDGVPARAATAAGSAVSYRFLVEETGIYRLRALGLGRTFRARLEDADGWPLMQPDVAADIRRELEPGEYRLIVLPPPVAARQVTLLERLPEALAFAGHGPHQLPLAGGDLDRQVSHVWREPEAGGERLPDVWRFSLPAALHATIRASDEMVADIFRRGGGGLEKVGYMPPDRGFSGLLEAGDYELHTTCVRVNNHVRYRLAFGSRELVAGSSRHLSTPVTVPLVVGREGLLEVSSFGTVDVRGRLYDAAGRLVAAADDRPGDWNFALARRLAAGEYQLRVDPVGSAGAETRIEVRMPREIAQPALVVPSQRRVHLAGAVHLLPLELPPGADFLAVTASSAEAVGAAVEIEAAGGGWVSAGRATGRRPRLELALTEGGARRIRLRLWSLDRRGNPIELAIAAGAVPRHGEAAARRGLRPAPAGDAVAVALAAVELERPGCFRVGRGVRVAARPGRAAVPAAGLVAAVGEVLWLAVDLDRGGGGQRLTVERAVLDPASGDGVRLRLPAGETVRCDLVPSAAPRLLRATAVAGQPMLAAGGWADGGFGGPPSLRRLAVGEHAALALAAPGPEPRLALWAGDASEALEVRLRGWSFPEAPPAPASWGTLEGELPAAGSAAWELPAGNKRLRLVLAPGVAAALAGDGGVHSLHWAQDESSEEVLESAAERLTLFHTATGAAAAGDAAARFRIEVLPVPDDDRLVPPSARQPFERRVARRGSLRLELAPADAPGAVLRLGGVDAAVLVAGDGSVARGEVLPWPEAGGVLHLCHGPGTVLARLETGAAGDAWGAAANVARTVLTPPALVPLRGAAMALEIAGDGPRMLHLVSATPLVSRLEVAGGAPRVEVHPERTAVDAYLPDGAARLALRSVGGGPLAGSAELRTSEVAEVGEGLGPEVLLAAGETRLFAFTVERSGEVGVGVRAEADVVETRLLDAGGGELGRGVVQLHDLTPGRYLLALRLPADAAPVRARPAVAGLERPDTGPPREVVERYLELAAAGER